MSAGSQDVLVVPADWIQRTGLDQFPATMSTTSKSVDHACIVGIGQSEFTPWGGIADRSQFQITAQAILTALDDAGLTKSDVDGFASFSNDSNDAPLMQVALGVPELR